jgi:ketosteroid isomerase-like protein
MIKVAFSTLASATLLSVCAPAWAKEAPQGAPLMRTGADVDAIRAIGGKWRELYTAGRFSEIPDLYTDDMMVMPRGRPTIVGRDAMRRSIGGLAAGRRVDISVAEREAYVVGDYGWFVGDFKVSYTPTTPNASVVTEYGRSLILFRRDADGQWRIHRDMDNPAPLPAAVGAAAVAPATSGAVPAMWNPASRTTVTECDRLASSKYDRTRLAKPKARDEIDVPAAIAQCEKDLLANPGDARINFHLGRLYGYAGDPAKTLSHRQAAAAAGNHNAIFLLGYLAWNAAKDDNARCAAARDMKLAADRGNYSAQITYASFWLEDRLKPCGAGASKDEVKAYVAAARPQVDGFFETRLVDHLDRQLQENAS